MLNVSYMVFTFLACVLGLGAGLVIHRAWAHTRQLQLDEIVKVKTGDKDDVEESRWEALAKWQASANRSFANCVLGCGAAPLLFAVIAWNNRSDVVTTICGGLHTFAGATTLCLI